MADCPEDVRKIIDGIVESASAGASFAQRLGANPLETLTAAGITPKDAATLLDAFADGDAEVAGSMLAPSDSCRPLTEGRSGPDDETPP